MESNEMTENRGDHQDHGSQELTVEVFSPREPKPKHFKFAKTQLVGQAAAEAAAAFGYPPNLTVSFQTKSGDVLHRDKTLAAAGVRDGDHLEIVDVGGGV